MSHQCNAMFNCSCGSSLWKIFAPKDFNYIKSEGQTLSQSNLKNVICKATDGGTILTLREGKEEFVEAIGIRDGKISVVGTLQTVHDSFADVDQSTINYKEISGTQALLPSFIEPHTHIVPSAITNIGTDVGPFDGQDLRTGYTQDWVIEQLRGAAKTAEAQMEIYNAEQKKEKNPKLKEAKDLLVLARSVDPSLFQGEHEVFDADVLDEVSKTIPVMVVNTSGHLAYINHAAIKKVRAETHKKVKTGENGVLAEFAEILPVAGVLLKDNLPGKEEISAQIDAIFDTAVERGATYMLDAALDERQYNMLNEIAQDGHCKVRIGGAYFVENLAMLNKDIIGKYQPEVGNENFNLAFLKLVSDGSAQGLTAYQYTPYDCNDYYDKYALQIDSTTADPQVSADDDDAEAKVDADVASDAKANVDATTEDDTSIGSKVKGYIDAKKKVALEAIEKVEAETKNYLDAKHKAALEAKAKAKVKAKADAKNASLQKNTGLFNYGYPLEFNAILATANNYGWPTMIHANGDHAIDRTLSAFKAAGINSSTKEQRRDRIEHCSLLSEQNMIDMAQLGISPSFTIGHVGYWGWKFKNTIIGQQRADQLDLCRSSLNDHQLRITMHSDYGVTPLGPLRMMEQAITRLMEGAPDNIQEVLNPNERITPFQALKAMTYDAAWQCHAEKWVGSLEVGKCADFVILAQSPLTYKSADNIAHPAQGMRNIPVLETWKGGQCVYKNLSAV